MVHVNCVISPTLCSLDWSINIDNTQLARKEVKMISSEGICENASKLQCTGSMVVIIWPCLR